MDGYDADTRDDGRTLVVTLRRRLEPMPQPEFKLPSTPPPVSASTARRGCRVLVLDAGHGGDDAGVQASGLTEKEVTLALASRLRPKLQAALPLRVEMLRNSDRTYSDNRRAEQANLSGGDLLLSLHCNGAFAPSTSGFEVLFATAGAAAAAAGDDFRPWHSAQRPYAARSQELGGRVVPERLPVGRPRARRRSLGAPRRLEVTGASITVCRSEMTSGRLRTRTGRRLSGALNR